MPHPYPGQEWKHGWKPISPAAKVSKNHGRKPGAGSLLSKVLGDSGERLKRMQAEDAARAKAKTTPNTSTAKAVNPAGKTPGLPSTKAPAKTHAKPAAKPTPAAKPKPAAPKSTAPKTAAPKTTKPRQGPKAGTDSHGKPLRAGDQVQLTGGKDQGKTGHVASKGKGGTVKVRTSDGREVDMHSENLRNKNDHDTSKQADAAIRKTAGRTPPANNPSDSGGSGAHATIPEIQNQVRDAYKELASKQGQWVGLNELRERLGKNLPRHKVDQALQLMYIHSNVHLTPESNQKTLTQADRDAAVHIGGQNKHLISIGS